MERVRTDRRRDLATIALASLLVALPSATFAQSESPAAGSAAPAAGSVKVGFISPTTGFVAALGTDMKRGWELYWELTGTTAGGVTV